MKFMRTVDATFFIFLEDVVSIACSVCWIAPNFNALRIPARVTTKAAKAVHPCSGQSPLISRHFNRDSMTPSSKRTEWQR